jgi:hypothetical protein
MPTPTRAELITYSSSFNADPLIFATVPQFNPAAFPGGVLARVSVRVQTFSAGQLIGFTTDGSTVNFTGNLRIIYGDSFYTKDTVLPLPLTADPSGFVNVFRDSFDVTLHFPAGAPFVGTGTIVDGPFFQDFPVSTPPDVELVGVINPVVHGTLTVTYVVTPEPASWISFLIGGACLCMVVRLRRGNP